MFVKLCIRANTHGDSWFLNIDFAISRVEINKIKNPSHGSNLLQLFVKDPAVSMIFCLKIDGIVL